MNLISKNKKFFCKIKLFFGISRVKLASLLRDKKFQTFVVAGCILLCVFLLTVHGTFAADAVPEKPEEQGIIGKFWGGIMDAAGSAIVTAISFILTAIQGVMNFLIGVAASIFSAVINPDLISGDKGLLNNNSVVKDIWIMVRDTFNMFFILVLLFSAFCTIFQIEKWNLKKVWLNILINALLVNFSYPIACFFIDVANVAMYYFVNSMFGDNTGAVTGNAIFAQLGNESQISTLWGADADGETMLMYQVMNIIMSFILGMTLLVCAVLFTIRLIALVILVMFSPIGFVGYIFPATSKFADDWWKNLFSYSFFGPIMIFVIGVAVKINQSIGKNIFKQSAADNAASVPGASEWIASASMFAIPIVILWMGMGVAKSLGIAGAETVTNTGKKWGKGLAVGAGMMMGGSWAAKNWKMYKEKRDERQKEIDKRRFGGSFGKGLNKLEDTGIGFAGEKISKGIGKVTKGKWTPKFGEKARSRVKGYQNTEFDELAKKQAEKIKNSEDTGYTAQQMNDFVKNNNQITDASGDSEVNDFIGRYKQMREDPGAKAAFEYNIRNNADNVRQSIEQGKIEAQKLVDNGTFEEGSDEHRAAKNSFQKSHMDSIVKNHWAHLAQENKNAQKKKRGEEIKDHKEMPKPKPAPAPTPAKKKRVAGFNRSENEE